jgi:hypothetical protein
VDRQAARHIVLPCREAGWKLTDDDGGSFALDGLSMPARGSLTVTLDSGLQLGNRGDEITLRDSGNQAVSVLSYPETENGRCVYR